jgi:hypothetical protein
MIRTVSVSGKPLAGTYDTTGYQACSGDRRLVILLITQDTMLAERLASSQTILSKRVGNFAMIIHLQSS